MSSERFISSLIPANGISALAYNLPQAFFIPAVGPYPLRKHINTTEDGVGGELWLAFENISLAPVSLVSIEAGPTKQEFKVMLEPSQLKGSYQLYCLESPEVELDTGGLMAPLKTEQSEVGDEEFPPMTPERYFRLVQLEQQRSQLNQTPNGRILVEHYNEHNDAYHEVFNTNEQLRKYWQQGGASQEMGDYTSEALKSQMVINPIDRTFGTEEITYNDNAFAQQLNLWAACAGKFPDAALAALNFNDQVTASTGNSGTTTVELTGSAIFETLNSASTRQLKSGVNLATLELESALVSLVVKQDLTQCNIDICRQHGFVMSPETCKRLVAIYQCSLRHQDPKVRLPISSDSIDMALAQSEFDYVVTEQPDGALTLKLKASTLRIPEFELGEGLGNIDMNGVNSRFIRGLLIDRITSQLTRRLRELARQHV